MPDIFNFEIYFFVSCLLFLITNVTLLKFLSFTHCQVFFIFDEYFFILFHLVFSLKSKYISIFEIEPRQLFFNSNLSFFILFLFILVLNVTIFQFLNKNHCQVFFYFWWVFFFNIFHFLSFAFYLKSNKIPISEIENLPLVFNFYKYFFNLFFFLFSLKCNYISLCGVKTLPDIFNFDKKFSYCVSCFLVLNLTISQFLTFKHFQKKLTKN